MKLFSSLVLIIGFVCRLEAQCVTIPSAAFSSTIVCSGSSTMFFDSSTTSSGSINSWMWDFGDSSSLNLSQNPSHIYANGGNYNVTLIVSNSLGCSDTIVNAIIVNPKPMVNFISDNTLGCQPFCTYFFDASSIAGGANVGWDWSFGDDDSISSATTVSHCYYNPSDSSVSFDVSLTVTSDSGCIATNNMSNLITVLSDSCSAAVAEIIAAAEFSIYPNPLVTQATIHFEKEQKNCQIKIIDILGAEVKSINCMGEEFVIEKGDMNSGIYFVLIKENEMSSLTKKIVVQ